MPRIKKEYKTKFPTIVEQLKKLHSDFTLIQRETYSRFKLGSAVTHRDMSGIGHIVGYWKDNSSGCSIAYFPSEERFSGSAIVPGCYSTSTFEEV